MYGWKRNEYVFLFRARITQHSHSFYFYSKPFYSQNRDTTMSVVYHTLCSTYCFNVFLFCDVKYDRGIFNLDGYPSLHLISCYDVVWCSELHVNYSIDLQHTCSYIITDVISKVRELPTLVRELPQIADRNWLRPRESSSSSQNPNCFQDLLRQLCHKET